MGKWHSHLHVGLTCPPPPSTTYPHLCQPHPNRTHLCHPFSCQLAPQTGCHSHTLPNTSSNPPHRRLTPGSGDRVCAPTGSRRGGRGRGEKRRRGRGGNGEEEQEE